jgi:hypothetical protein
VHCDSAFQLELDERAGNFIGAETGPANELVGACG